MEENLIEDIVKKIKSLCDISPQIAMILGSGLQGIADKIENKVTIPYAELGMPQTKVAGHKSQFVLGSLKSKAVIAMQGRFHLYDGFSAKQVCLPIYIFKKLGVKKLIVTNASGALNPDFECGDIMQIVDQINLTGQNALVGGALVDYGEQFIDMSEPYSKKLVDLSKKIAQKNNITLKEGTYIQVLGPLYETNAYAKMLHNCGGDAVAMSTAIEVESAVQCGIDVVGYSVITDMAIKNNQQKTKTSHKEILNQSRKATEKLSKIIEDLIATI